MTLEQTESTANEDIIRDTEEPHTLACKMTEAELQGEQDNLLRLLQDVEELDLQKKSVVADFASRKKKLDEMLEASRKKLGSKDVMRSIMCTLKLNFTKLTATLFRQDTYEQVNERPMNEEERRMLNETPDLPGMEEEEPESQEPVGDTLKFPETMGNKPGPDFTEPPETEPLTPEEATAEATDKFGPGEDPQDIGGAADLSDDEPEEEKEYNFGLEGE